MPTGLVACGEQAAGAPQATKGALILAFGQAVSPRDVVTTRATRGRPLRRLASAIKIFPIRCRKLPSPFDAFMSQGETELKRAGRWPMRNRSARCE